MNNPFNVLFCVATYSCVWVSAGWADDNATNRKQKTGSESTQPDAPMHELARHRGDSAFLQHSANSAKSANQNKSGVKSVAGKQPAGGNSQQAVNSNIADSPKSPFSLPSSAIQNRLDAIPAAARQPNPPIVLKMTDDENENSTNDDLTANTNEAQVDEEGVNEEGDDDEAPQTIFPESFHQLGPITFEYIYTGEMFSNAHGGISTKRATKYRGNLDVTMTLDTEAANWWTGGEVFMYMLHSHGTTLTPEFVGDGQYYSSIDTGPRPQDLTRLGESWYRQTSDDDSISVKFGLQDANADFAYADLGGDFLNSSFVTIPNIPLPFWPFQTLGLSSLYQHNDRLRLGTGMYDQGRNQQQWWVDSADQGLFFLAQADYLPFADCEGALLTIVKFGSWFTSADTNSVDGLQTFDGNYGFYTTVDRMLFAERGAEDQGLGAFFQFSWAPHDRNQVDRNFAAGLVYRGLLNDRDQDTCGVGYTGLFFSEELGAISGQTSEDVMELFYKARLRPWLSLQPDLQYIARPNGLERDALVVGARFEAIF